MTEDILIEAPAPRVLPKLTDANRQFWTGGAGGSLLVPRCRTCDTWVLPPPSVCPGCGGPVESEPVSGRATIYTFTVNSYQFHPDVPPPNVIAIVQLDEQDDLRVATNIVRCPPEDVRCGMAVRVLFEQHGEIYYPVFEPNGPVS